MAVEITDIASLPAWHFWTRPSYLGVSPEETALLHEGKPLPPERIAAINFRIDASYDYLANAEVQGRCN